MWRLVVAVSMIVLMGAGCTQPESTATRAPDATKAASAAPKPSTTSTPPTAISPVVTPSPVKPAKPNLGKVVLGARPLLTPLKTALPSREDQRNLAAFIRVKGTWTGEIRVPKSLGTDYVRCTQGRNINEDGDRVDVYEFSTTKRKWRTAYLKPGGVRVQIERHRTSDKDDRTFLGLNIVDKDHSYNGQDADEPDPDETHATRLQYSYENDKRVRFSGNMTVTPDLFTGVIGSVYFYGWINCPSVGNDFSRIEFN